MDVNQTTKYTYSTKMLQNTKFIGNLLFSFFRVITWFSSIELKLVISSRIQGHFGLKLFTNLSSFRIWQAFFSILIVLRIVTLFVESSIKIPRLRFFEEWKKYPKNDRTSQLFNYILQLLGPINPLDDDDVPSRSLKSQVSRISTVFRALEKMPREDGCFFEDLLFMAISRRQFNYLFSSS